MLSSDAQAAVYISTNVPFCLVTPDLLHIFLGQNVIFQNSWGVQVKPFVSVLRVALPENHFTFLDPEDNVLCDRLSDV